ncbi:MAG: DedA family protein [Actinomycetes bacterium]
MADPGTDSASGVAELVLDLVAALGAPGVGVAVAAENLFPPIPSEVVLPLAGISAARGEMSLVGAVGWSTVGSVVGALLLYWLGAALGTARLQAAWEKLPLTSADDILRAEAWFHRWGELAVLLGRCVPVVRSAVSVPAGVTRMPLVRFTALTLAGSLVWNATFVGLGYALGDQVDAVTAWVDRYQLVVLAALVLGVVTWVVRRTRD